MSTELYTRQAELLVRAIPEIAHEETFALKGGTAINLFVRDRPQHSVDIDLVYLPIADRDESLAAIREAFSRIATSLRKRLSAKVIVTNKRSGHSAALIRREALMLLTEAHGLSPVWTVIGERMAVEDETRRRPDMPDPDRQAAGPLDGLLGGLRGKTRRWLQGRGGDSCEG